MERILPGFDFETVGVEDEEDLAQITPDEIAKSYLWATDWTVETLINQIRKGYVELNPVFQRRDAWRGERKSRFIESVILNLPIPQIVLAEKDDKLVVVDGKQRLLSLMQFAGGDGWNPLKLSGLQILKLNGQSFEDLQDTPYLAKFENNTIRTVILKNGPSDSVINLVFGRLNTNSVALSPQELRQSILAGPFLVFAESYTRENHFLAELFGGEDADFRMRDVELLIRFVAFRINLGRYSGNLKKFLDDTCRYLNKNWESEGDRVRSLCDELQEAVRLSQSKLGTRSFRKYVTQDESFEYRFNRAIFDVVTYYLSFPKNRHLVSLDNDFLQRYMKLFENPEFVNSIETTTKSLNAVTTRFTHFKSVFGFIEE